MFSASTVTPARSPRSNGDRPSGSVCEKKCRSRMSALKARASAARPGSAETAPQPAAARCWFTSASTWPSALGSAGAAAATGGAEAADEGLVEALGGPPVEALVKVLVEACGAGSWDDDEDAVAVSCSSVVVSGAAAVGGAGCAPGASVVVDRGGVAADGVAVAAGAPSTSHCTTLERWCRGDVPQWSHCELESRPTAVSAKESVTGCRTGTLSATPAATPQTVTTGTRRSRRRREWRGRTAVGRAERGGLGRECTGGGPRRGKRSRIVTA